jgi:hypothetical protein
MVRPVRLLALALAVSSAVQAQEHPEIPILVPSPIPVGFLVAWKPTLLSIRTDSGQGAQFGSDKVQPLRGLGRYTTTFIGEKLLARAEIEGGQFQSDTQSTPQRLGTDGYDFTLRLLGGTATRIIPDLMLTASAGLLTRYQWGRASGGAPRIGVIGVTSNAEVEFRIAPQITFSAYVEGGLTPFPYFAQENLGLLSDASEFRWRLQFSLDVSPGTAIDIGYDYTRWHAAFTESSALGIPNQALLIEAREHALTIGVRWKP